MGEDLDLIEAELDEALDAIDDMVDVIGKQIIAIAYENKEFVCSQCLDTAAKLYRLMNRYAREEDANETAKHFKDITGRNIGD